MPLPIKDVMKFLVDNINNRGVPVPVPKNALTEWAKGLKLAKGGDVIIYTGQLYQLAPYIESTIDYLSKLEIEGGKILKVARVVSKLIDLSRFIPQPDSETINFYNNILRNIVSLLKATDLNFGYLYEDELYSGVLLYDMGMFDEFRNHADKVYKKLKKYNVKKIITVDPHTTYIMSKIYPSYFDSYNFEVINYIDLLSNSDLHINKKLDSNFVIHDPCFYTRYNDIIEQPRKLLTEGGIRVLDPPRSGKMTFCCGGPVESISPTLSKAVAELRMEELRKVSYQIVTLCPICLTNLRKVSRKGDRLLDISDILRVIYGV